MAEFQPSKLAMRVRFPSPAPMRRPSLWVATVIVGVALSPCGGRNAVAPDGIFFPTVPIGDSYPAGLMEGALQVDDGCVYVVMGDERWLVLWPEGSRATFDGGRLAVHDPDGLLVAHDGGPVRLGGGEINPVEVVEARRRASTCVI